MKGKSDGFSITGTGCFFDGQKVGLALSPRFLFSSWWSVDGGTFIKTADLAYYTVVRWKRNLFRVPFRKTGIQVFVSELSRLFREYATGSILRVDALKAIMFMPSMLIQHPYRHSKHKKNVGCLERPLPLRADGNIQVLLLDAQSTQDQLKISRFAHNKEEHCASGFATLVMQGKIKAAFGLLDDASTGGTLCLRSM